jgi:hypothetical protein
MIFKIWLTVGTNYRILSFRSNICFSGINLKKQIVKSIIDGADVDFLECMMDLASEPLESRLVQHLLSSPIGDGGQFDMVIVTLSLTPLI